MLVEPSHANLVVPGRASEVDNCGCSLESLMAVGRGDNV